MMNRNRILYFLLLFCFEFIILINSIGGDFSSWPRFYEWGESTVPTQQILNNLTFYQLQWQDIKVEEYSLVFAWDCSPCRDECNAANKFINVVDGKISSVKVAELNDKDKLLACHASTSPTNISDYKTINELYAMTIDWVSTCLEADDPSICKVIELILHKTFLFPMAVKLSKGAQFIEWDIPCFQPGHIAEEQKVCEYSSSTYADPEPQWSFWITEEMQSFLGWSMIFLILVACSLGYCINWLKKKKSEKIEAWREKEERQRQEKEKQKAAAKAKKKKRKSSKAKHRAHLEKARRSIPEQQYASLNQMNDDQSAEELLYDHYDVTEEEHKRDID